MRGSSKTETKGGDLRSSILCLPFPLPYISFRRTSFTTRYVVGAGRPRVLRVATTAYWCWVRNVKDCRAWAAFRTRRNGLRIQLSAPVSFCLSGIRSKLTGSVRTIYSASRQYHVLIHQIQGDYRIVSTRDSRPECEIL